MFKKAYLVLTLALVACQSNVQTPKLSDVPTEHKQITEDEQTLQKEFEKAIQENKKRRETLMKQESSN